MKIIAVIGALIFCCVIAFASTNTIKSVVKDTNTITVSTNPGFSQEEQFGTKSIVISGAALIEFMFNTNVEVKDFAAKIKYTEPNTNSVDYYIHEIAKAYDLPLYTLSFTGNNAKDLNQAIKSAIVNDGRVLVTYAKDTRTHCAMIFGYTFDAKTNITGFISSDPGTSNPVDIQEPNSFDVKYWNLRSDLINPETLVSKIWKLKIANIYWFK